MSAAAVLVGGAGAVAGATWVSGEHGLAIGLVAFDVLAAGITSVWSSADSHAGAICASEATSVSEASTET